MTRTIELPYATARWPFAARRVEITGIYAPLPTRPAHDPQALVRATLDNPIESIPLREAARGKASALILIDDITRETPADLLLPPILDDLEAAGLEADDSS